MGVSALEDICNSLLQAGMDEEMPAAILQKGTTAGQKELWQLSVPLQKK